MMLALILGLAAELDANAPIACAGEHRQGAMIVCRSTPGAQVQLGDVAIDVDEHGWVVLGHDRDADAATQLSVTTPDGGVYERLIVVEQREYDIQRIEGVAPRFVSPPAETLERRQREGAQKAAAYRSDWDGAGFAGGFVMPIEGGRITGVYGSQRFYNGEPRRPHYGIDVAAPNGTPVTAPAGGVVTLAEPDMYWEGGLIFIDHGQGFTSAFLHLSEVIVEVGDVVEQGQSIGAVGAGGRSTGAHLDWRIKWRDRYIDPGETLGVDPAALAD
ncbi:MAG: M23 family metallopeptidase [Pseudomonadota bacterium]